MALSYRYVEHTADLGFEAWGASLEAMFVHAAEALMAVLVDPGTVEPASERPVEIKASGLESLLVSWLNELLYVFDAEQWIFARFEINSADDKRLDAMTWGEPLDPRRHSIKTTIKAATYHRLSIKNRDGLWRCRVFVDL